MNTVEIIFSPTGGTQKVARTLSGCWSEHPVTIDLSDPTTDLAACTINKDDRVVVAMPSFGGRAPAVAIQRLKRIAGNGAQCVLVCVYGNRAYEDTLAEMEDAARQCGLRVVAAVAAVAQHSIMPQYAAGRPDAADIRQLQQFAEQIGGKAEAAASIPGQQPYKKAGGAGLVPKPGKNCTHCGQCAKSCPVQAIEAQHFTADPHKCISCMRCVKQCPANARTVNNALVSVAALAIRKACSVRKENELFL